jgi:hypothetical protein
MRRCTSRVPAARIMRTILRRVVPRTLRMSAWQKGRPDSAELGITGRKAVK